MPSKKSPLDIDESLNTPAAPITEAQRAAEQAALIQSAEFLAETAARRAREGKNSDMARLIAAQDKKQAADVKERATKEEMLGADIKAFQRTRDLDDAVINFVVVPPKLGALPVLMDEIATRSQDAANKAELIMHLCTAFLYVKDAASGLKHRATVTDISECLEMSDLEMLQDMIERYMGISMKPETDADSKKK